MTRYTDKLKAIAMRRKGLSYSAIRAKLVVSKSTLSYWLRDIPLSREQINELRAFSPKRIEKYRATMMKKRTERLRLAYKNVSDDVQKLSKREMFIAGLFLYWGEGGKTMPYTISLTNTDPRMIRFYMKWLQQLEVPRIKIKIRLHLYTDMNILEKKQFWSKVTGLPFTQFNVPYVKKSDSKRINYRGHRHGTCTIVVNNRDVADYVLQGLTYIQNMFL